MGTLPATPLILLFGVGLFVLVVLNNVLVDRRPPTVIYLHSDPDTDRSSLGCVVPLVVLLFSLYLLWAFGHVLVR